MRRLIFTLTAILCIGVHSFAQGSGWPLTQDCAAAADPLPFDGVIVTANPDEGVRALRSSIGATYFVAFAGSNFTQAGALSPDGRYFAVPYGTIQVAGSFDNRARITELRLHTTDPVPQIVRRIPWDATFQDYEIPAVRWLDSETILFAGGKFAEPKVYYTVNVFADEITPQPTPLGQYETIAPDQQQGIGRYQDSYALYELSSGWVIRRLVDMRGFVWNPVASVFAALVQDGATRLLALLTPDAAQQTILTLDERYVVRNFTWSPDGERFAFSLFDPQEDENRLVIGDTRTETLMDTCILLHNAVRGAVWSPAGDRLAVVTSQLEIFDLAANTRHPAAPFSGGLIGWGAN